jgi:AcrR family transcriptional regulator
MAHEQASSDTPPAEFAADPSPGRERILVAALRAFAHQGYATTPVRQIAEDAGVAAGLVYYHFEDKAGLLRAIFERSLDDVAASLDAADAAACESPREGLDRLVRTAFATVARNQDFWRLGYQLRMQPSAADALGGAIPLWAEEIRGRVEALLARSGHPDPVPASRALFAAIDGAAQHFVLDPDHYPLDPVATSLVDHFTPDAGRKRRGR